jgi:hypothetical protein
MAEAQSIVYCFTVTKFGVIPNLLKALVAMAVRETDLVFSPARRKLETDVRISKIKPGCAVTGGTECGEHLAKLLCGFLIKQVGENGFLVERRLLKRRFGIPPYEQICG